jgi:hypothetical protein
MPFSGPILHFFQAHPMFYLPLFFIALYLVVVFIKRLIVKIIAAAVILFTAWVGYYAFILPNKGLPVVKTIQSGAGHALDKAKDSVGKWIAP